MGNPINAEIAAQLTESLRAGLTDSAMTALKKQVQGFMDDIAADIDYRLRDDLAPNLTAYVEDMAKRTVAAILDGNQSEMERYLGCERGHWTGRSDSPSYGARQRTIEEWHPVIHGKLFEQGSVALRKKIVEAHRDLIASQRILDLEDQLASVVAQYNALNSKMEEQRGERWS